MTMTFRMKNGLRAACVALAALVSSGAVSAQEATLSAIVSLPKSNSMNSPFFKMLDEVNQKGKGQVRVRLVGGPEVMPTNEQMSAISRGVTDIYFGATAYYSGQIPEMTAFSGSNKSAMQLRKEGHLDYLDKSFNQRVNAKLLGYYGSGYSFHIYLRNEPRRTADGGVDLKGLKVRGSPSYAAQFDALGIVRVNTPPAEVYNALERGLLDGFGFPTMGVTDQGWEKFVKYRIFPTFKQGDFALVMNLDKWNKLSQPQRDLIQSIAIRHEEAAHNYFMEDAKRESKKFAAAGMHDVRLTEEGAKRYAAAFYDTLWEPLGSTIGKDAAAELRRRFYDPNLLN